MENTNTNQFNMFFILVIVAIAAGCTFASDIYLPAFPALTQAFMTTKSAIQLTLTAYFLGFSLFQLVWGPLSDRFGRRPFILLGLLICAFGTLICVATSSLSLFFIGRVLQGVGAAAGMSLVRTMARDAFVKEQLSKVFSIMGMVFALSFTLAPTLGGYLYTLFGWRSNFIFVLFYMIVMLIITWVYLPETNKNLQPLATDTKTMMRNYATLLSSKVFMGYSICYGLVWSGLVAYASLSPFIFQNVLHLSPIAYGHLSLFIAAGLIAASFINSSVVVKVGSKYMMVFGLVLLALSSIIMYAIGMFNIINILVIMLPLFVFVVGIGIISANSGAGALSPFGHIAGSAGALYGCVQMFMTFIISYVVSLLHTDSQQTLAATLVILSLIASGFYYFGAHVEVEKE